MDGGREVLQDNVRKIESTFEKDKGDGQPLTWAKTFSDTDKNITSRTATYERHRCTHQLISMRRRSGSSYKN